MMRSKFLRFSICPVMNRKDHNYGNNRWKVQSMTKCFGNLLVPSNFDSQQAKSELDIQ